jgi:hypothetical protein
LGSTVCFFLALYLLDISYWRGRWVFVKEFFFGVGGVGVIFAALLCTNINPAAPLTVFCILVVAYTRTACALFFPSTSRPDFLIALSWILYTTGFVLLIIWAHATFASSGSIVWTTAGKRDLETRSGCEEGVRCVVVYLLWGGPFIGCVACWVMGTFSHFLGYALRRESHAELAGVHTPSALGMGAARVVIGTVVALGFGMWCAASVAVSGSGLSNALFGLTIMSATALIGMVVSAVGWDSIKTSIGHNPLVVKLAELRNSDWLKALVVLVCWLPFLCYLALAMANQIVRRVTCDGDSNFGSTKGRIEGGGAEDGGGRGAKSAAQTAREGGSTLKRLSQTLTAGGARMSGFLRTKKEQDAELEIRKLEARRARQQEKRMAKLMVQVKRQGQVKRQDGGDGEGASSPHRFTCLTLVASEQLYVLVQWRWASVLCKIMWWALFLVSINVGVTKVVTLFLSWMNTSLLAPLPLGAVIGIFYAIGLFMFLLPPVPGVPVYLTSGVVIVHKVSSRL